METVDPPVAVWAALRHRRFLGSWWPWRCWAYQLSGVLLGSLTLAGLVACLVTAGGLTIVGVGVVLLLLVPLYGTPVGSMERRRLRLVEPEPVVPPHRSTGIRRRLRDRATWRELGYTLLFGLVFTPASLGVALLLTLSVGFLVSPALVAVLEPDSVMLIPGHAIPHPAAALPFTLVGLAGVALCGYLAGLVSGVQVATVRFLLAQREDLRVLELTRSRASLADAFEAERRRIEQDLHDGAQQQLVALTMTLGLAARENPGSELVARAQGQARLALEQLRDLVRGINPQVLTDHGLAAAVSEVAHRGAVPVTMDIELPGRLPGAVETIAYFTVTEALTNVAKHSGADCAGVVGRLEHGALILLITDNGRGGADPEQGSGLRGLATRLAILHGTLTVTSPVGGPTQLRVEIPCSG